MLTPKKVVIVGGGIAGLTAAYRLEQQGQGVVTYRLLESLPRLGGKITSARQDGFLIEGGPDSFHAYKPAALELCRSLGLETEIIGLKSASGKAMILSRGKLRPMPIALSSALIVPLLRSSLISLPGKLRMGMEFFVPPSGDDAGDESMASFVRRRLGQEALDKIADPLLAGIHAADPERLSLGSTFPALQKLESEHGGLLRALWARRKTGQRNAVPQPRSPLLTLRGGLQRMIDRLTTQLDARAIRLNQRILALRRTFDGYEIFLKGEPSIRADAIIFAAPAYATADLFESIDPVLASKLREIRYVSTATVSLGFRRRDVPGELDGSGYLVAHGEGRDVLGCTWSSSKFDGRAPDDHVLMRIFIGGARAEHLAEQDDDRLLEVARQEVAATMGIRATPLLTKVYRWLKANPQYEVGHQARIQAIYQLITRHHGLYLAGAGYGGIGIPDCIQSGNRAAQALLQDVSDANTLEPQSLVEEMP
jgi:oxygen-dependent protoporphyrinogen oxidase